MNEPRCTALPACLDAATGVTAVDTWAASMSAFLKTQDRWAGTLVGWLGQGWRGVGLWH
jgi:hypothetical protein